MLSHSVFAMEGTKSTQGSQRQVRTTYSRKKNKKPVIELDVSNDVDDDDNFISSLTGGHRGRKREETELSKQTLKRNEESNIDPYSFEFERHTPSKLQKEIRLGSEIKLNKNDNKNSSGKGRTKMTDDAHDLSRAKPKQMRLNPKTISKTREDEAVDPYSFEFEAISPSKLQAELRGLSGTPDTPKLTAKHRSIEHTTKSSHSAESSAKSLVSPCKQSTSTRLAAKVPDTQTKTFNTTPSKKLDKTNQQSHSPARKKTPPKRRISETSDDPFNFSFESQLINKKQKRRVDSISRDKSSPLSDPFHWEDNPSRPVSHSKKPLEVRKGGVVLGVTRSKSFSESQTSEDFPGSSQNSNDGWDLDDDDDDSANVKTMHELRHAGENKRFTDEMNYLIDGLGRSQKINVRRSSSIDLIRKLLQKDIRRKIRIHNMITPVIANLKGEPDLILQSSHLVILLFILSDADNHTVSDLICECSCVEMLLNSLLLPVKKDPFQHDKLFASGSKGKAEKMMISDLKDILNASELHELCHVSFPSLAHNCLTYLVSNLSASSSDNSVAHSKFEIAFQSCNGYDAYMTFMRSADALRVVESQDDVLPVELGEWQKYLKVLEYLSFISQRFRNALHEEMKLLESVAKLIPRLSRELEGNDEPTPPLILLQTTLRPLINLTNDNHKLSQSIASTELLQTLLHLILSRNQFGQIKNFDSPSKRSHSQNDEDEGSLLNDHTVLGAGLLINLIENDQESRTHLRNIDVNAIKKVSSGFTTSQGSKNYVIHAILAAYLEFCSDETTATTALTFSVLLSILMQDLSRSQILAIISPSSPMCLPQIVEHLTDFLAVYEQEGTMGSLTDQQGSLDDTTGSSIKGRSDPYSNETVGQWLARLENEGTANAKEPASGLECALSAVPQDKTSSRKSSISQACRKLSSETSEGIAYYTRILEHLKSCLT